MITLAKKYSKIKDTKNITLTSEIFRLIIKTLIGKIGIKYLFKYGNSYRFDNKLMQLAHYILWCQWLEGHYCLILTCYRVCIVSVSIWSHMADKNNFCNGKYSHKIQIDGDSQGIVFLNF